MFECVSGAPTPDRILDAAEVLFAERGFAATSMRQLTASAGVNLAAVNYHFGSKEQLIVAVFARRLLPINRERLERFDRLEARHAPDPIPLRELLTAFFAPVLQRIGDTDGAAVLRLFGRMYSEPAGSRVTELFLEQFRAVRDRIVPLLARALPSLSRTDLWWRTHLMIGSMAHVLACPHGLRALSDGACDPGDADLALRQLVAFGAAGASAPSVAPREGDPA